MAGLLVAVLMGTGRLHSNSGGGEPIVLRTENIRTVEAACGLFQSRALRDRIIDSLQLEVGIKLDISAFLRDKYQIVIETPAVGGLKGPEVELSCYSLESCRFLSSSCYSVVLYPEWRSVTHQYLRCNLTGPGSSMWDNVWGEGNVSDDDAHEDYWWEVRGCVAIPFRRLSQTDTSTCTEERFLRSNLQNP